MSSNIAEMRQKAEAGSCVNQCALGLRFLHGIDVQVDYKEAFRFLSSAAEQGASRAVLNLAYMYAEGLGIPKDVAKAISMLEAVASPADSSDAFLARIELGRIYSRGAEVPVDADAALKWYTAAIAQAEPETAADSDELREARAYVARERRT